MNRLLLIGVLAAASIFLALWGLLILLSTPSGSASVAEPKPTAAMTIPANPTWPTFP